MSNILFSMALVVILLVALTLNKSFNHLPIKELKLKARDGHQPEKTLFRVSAYGDSLHALLLVIIILSAAGSFTLIAYKSVSYLAFIIIAILIWLAFIYLPTSRSSSTGYFLAKLFTPILAWVLDHTHSVFSVLSRLLHDQANNSAHSGIYDREDLISLLEWQKTQADSRISTTELNMAKSVVSFGETLVSEILVPKREVIVVNESDLVSPVLIDELHKSGLNFFPVYSNKKDNIVGVLFIGDLLDQAKSSKLIKNIMDTDVYYLHEDFELLKVFKAFLKTHHHLFIVVNKFEEFVGVVSIENILSEMLGEPILDEFDSFEDLRAVAAAKAKIEHQEHTTLTPKAEEMIE
jgi:CBS domain containing-hemolysin-like protein